MTTNKLEKSIGAKRTVCKMMLVILLISLFQGNAVMAQFPRFRALLVYSDSVETAHVQFARDALRFFKDLTVGDGFALDSTKNMADFNEANLGKYQLVIWLNIFPVEQNHRKAFEQYMEHGGGWMGFHVAGYNDKTTQWPWFVQFLGGAVFYTNNWPPMPAKLMIEDQHHPITRGMPESFTAPINEWYQWRPSPRLNKRIKVLASLSPDNYPFGLKDIIQGGDTPVIWSNLDYRMIYLNMGHGPHIFTDATQNRLIMAALRWVVATDKKGNPFER